MDCIINPKTRRAVKKTSALGKKLMKNPDKTLKEDCIINPKSGRAVRKDSVLGKKILAGMKPLKQKTMNFDEIEARTHTPSREAPPVKPKTPPAKPKKVRKPRVAKPKLKTPSTGSANDDLLPLQQITEEVEEQIIIPPPPKERTKVAPQKSKSTTIFIAEDTSQNKYSLDRRIKLYNKAKIYLDKISEKECITRVKSGSKDLLTLSNMLFMDKRIGTESASGAIFLSSVKNVPDLSVVSKITKKTTDNLTELIIMEKLTEKLVKTKKTKHFPLLYTTHICPDPKEKLSVVSVNELCNGDLKMLANDPSINTMKPEIIVNIIYQILISLTTFHIFGYLHDDTHWGNFLYQNNTEEGYYEYEYKGQSFWIPSCPYNIMLYDFGLSKKLKNPNDKKCFGEFLRPLYAFQPEDEPTGGWNDYATMRPINRRIANIQKIISTMAYDKNVGRFGGKVVKPKEDIFITLLKILDSQFNDMIYKTTLKGSDIILNDKPFIIA
jgi:hypothetical protein